MSTIEINQLGEGGTHLDQPQLAELSRRLDGSLLLPGDPGWDSAIQTWNGMVATTPALVIQPRSPGDVSTSVTFAREHGLSISMRGGGHNIAGTSIAPGGVTFNMSLMSSVLVEAEARLVHVDSGCLLGNVDNATQEKGLATVLGFVSETGVAGLTLGGGFGYLTRRFGWTVDNLEEVEIVTADGEIRVASRRQHDELFWAIRGGSGNFGVVTRFTFRLHEVGPLITGGLIAWDARRSDEVLGTYRELTATAPRELTTAVIVRLAPAAPFVPEQWHGRKVAAMVVCYTGHNPESALAPIRKLGQPVVDTIRPMPYVHLQSMLNALEPKGPHRYWKTEFLPGLSEGFLAAFRDGALGVTSPLSQSVIFHVGGELNDHPDDDGAVGNRDAQFIGGFAGTWPPDVAPEPHINWVRESWARIRQYSTGGNYVNFQLADDDQERLMAAYRGNYQRLREVKAAYDPDNFFRVNRNISPA
ncbi:MAG: FAD-binding oxidoreductase [Acidimicrobiia bacterium]